MKATVLIPAHDEEHYLGRCLEKLDASLTEPIVLANDCSDGTVAVAKKFGAAVFETEQPGKLPAIQNALRLLNTYGEPFIIIDADTYPLLPRTWVRQMTNQMNPRVPEIRTGPIYYNPDTRNVFHALLRTVGAEKYARSEGSHLVAEANMALNLDQSTLDEIIVMDHYWPGEGYMMRQKVWEHNGTYSRAGLQAGVVTSMRRLGTLKDRHNWLQGYRDRAPEGSIVPEDLVHL